MPFKWPFSRSDETELLRAELKARTDGYFSNEMGFGTDADKAIADWQYSADFRMQHAQVDQIYRSHGLAQKIVNHPASEATREWIQVTHDQADEINKALETPAFTLATGGATNQASWKQLLTLAYAWSRAYGGAAVVLDVDDGQDPAMPVNLNRVRGVFPRYVVDSRHLIPVNYLPWQPVELYQLLTYNLTYIHPTRLLIFDGIDCGPLNRHSNNGWGEKIFDVINRPLQNYSTDYAEASTLLKDHSLKVFRQPNFANNVKTNGAKYAMKQAKIRQRMASAVRALVIDKEEEFLFVNRNIAGVAELVRLAKEFLCSVTWIPHSELFEESPGASLGEGGSYQSRAWYNRVKQLQGEHFESPLHQLLGYLGAANDWAGPIPFSWKSLWQMNPLEKADLYSKTALADFQYWQMGVLHPPDLQSRFTSHGFSQDITVTPIEDLNETEDPPEAPHPSDELPAKP